GAARGSVSVGCAVTPRCGNGAMGPRFRGGDIGGWTCVPCPNRPPPLSPPRQGGGGPRRRVSRQRPASIQPAPPHATPWHALPAPPHVTPAKAGGHGALSGNNAKT